MSIHNNHFYHSLIKSYTVLIGSILDGIDVVKYKQDGTEDVRVRVPVVYSNKEKWVRRILEDPELKRQPAITLPRIGFEMNGMQYAPDRKLSGKQQFIFRSPTEAGKSYRVYTPVPYDFVFTASLIAKTQEDALQVIEQIVPFFTPDYTVNMKGIKNPNISFDIPITLDSVQKDDQYEGRFEDNRMIIWTLSFVLKGFLFGPVKESGIIKHIDMTMYHMDQLDVAPELRNFIVDYNIEPYINGVALADISFDDDYEIRTEILYG